MQIVKRLTEAYKNARVEHIDEDSKYVFFSDCHRGAGSLADEFTRNENAYNFALKYYFDNGFTYVEAGDGDELWEHPNFSVIKNAHHEAFANIKKFYDDDRLILLYGNHNIYLKNQEYVRDNYYTFYDHYHKIEHDFLQGIEPLEALVLKVKKTGQEILIVHGHQGDLVNDHLWFFTMLSLKYFWRFLHAYGIQNPASPVKNAQKRHKLERNYNKWIKKYKMMLICGHTHRVKFPKSNELPYFNMGCCVYPTRITAIEISNGNIQLVQWHTRPNHTGALKVTREIIQGPAPLYKFDIRKSKN
ncbi:UDP-2,3-diacylglucosamine pyrophosphatase LpxH [Alkalithermobacter thermoalcaliphilus JW-YL-7 = DSM 7308]|uniref:Ser/Thr protein phosphatase family protein n=1 Tax=Alkalithermobacter thermoalcaliphilus JW-YL-7 = DSM 7308 TaxID=1121328 RepID=A0A150FPQ5_CLOPD|nr:Ser/Thr protein phosphatase family protein [[Clostridium] paradoxum JW-YL-7 = DSM 7308]SHL32237.1 UDP-2,3-diacylglucosamine pyrophosphatase LpxH [[Clostridium] paradoxum JW-YL-7 = DSM 7308]